jgi:tRNA A37 threonylcarbamoyltransferase TsaD
MNMETVFPQKSLCTDNAAMVAGLAYHKLSKDHVSDYSMNPVASMSLGCRQ